MIKVEGLTKLYNEKTDRQVEALSSVSFSVNEKEIVNIVGKSGSGKSTLSNVLLGIIKPTSGTFTIDGDEFGPKSKSKHLRVITTKLLSSFQYPTHQIFSKTVEEELLFNVEDKEYAYELVERFSFDRSLFNKSPFNLSAGQKRKLILISILAQRPKVIVFDEATAFLDPKSRREFVELIKVINKELGTTIIFISHNLEDALSLTERTILLDSGKLIRDGNTKEVIKDFEKGVGHGK